MDNIKLLYIQMVSKRTVQRRRNSKRQKRRSLKRQNRKSRKVMRGGGGGDPLKDVKQNDLVSVVLKDNTHPKGYPASSNDMDITIICQVVSVENTGSPKQKTVKLRITGEEITFGYVYGGNNVNGRPVEFSDNFDIIYTPSEIPSKPAYFFRIYKRDSSGKLEVIPDRIYTHIKVNNKEGSYVMQNGWVIKSVQPITASR